MLTKKEYAKYLIFVSFLYGMMVLGLCLQHNKNIYPETARIIDLQESGEGYVITFETGNGNLFLYESNDRDFYENEVYSLLMNSKGTKTVKDDRIVKLKYVMSENR